MLLIHVPKLTNRLGYTLKVVFNHLLHAEYSITTDAQYFLQYGGAKLSYGQNRLDDSLFINTNGNFDAAFSVTADGSIEITPLSVSVAVTGSTDTKTYSGSEQSVSGYTVEISDPLYTESDFTFTGEAAAKGTNVGTWMMGLSAGQFANTNSNFTVSFSVAADGSLTISAKDITLTTRDETKTYDGSPLPESTDHPPVIEGLVGGDADVVYAGATGYQLDAGESDNTAEIYWGTVDSGNYNVIPNFGTLHIDKRSVTLTSADNEKVYDGEDLTDDTVTVGGEGFAPYEGASFTVTGVQRAVGKSRNTFTYTLDAGTLADNYEITKVEGWLTVKPIEFCIYLGGVTVNYTGENVSFNREGVYGKYLSGDLEGEIVEFANDGEEEDSATYYFNLGDTECMIVVTGIGKTPGQHQITYNLTVEEGSLDGFQLAVCQREGSGKAQGQDEQCDKRLFHRKAPFCFKNVRICMIIRINLYMSSVNCIIFQIF